MSKSKGNFYTVRDLLEEGFSGNVIRLYIISSHYRSETDFSKEGLEKAQKELQKVKRTLQRIQKFGKNEKDDLEAETERLYQDFERSMDDDINTAKAKQTLMKYVNQVNAVFDEQDSPGVGQAEKSIVELFGVLGVNLEETRETETELVETMINLREKARESQDYETSDYVRDRLEELGFDIEDADKGTIWTSEN